jgi:AraC-like DNA-binding protein
MRAVPRRVRSPRPLLRYAAEVSESDQGEFSGNGVAYGARGLTPRQETLRTWGQQRLAARSASAPRRVDWPLIVGGGLRLPLAQAPLAAPDAFAVLRASDELAQYRDLNTLLRRAVELARRELRLERVAIFMCAESPDLLEGTWGTGREGETTDEREIAFLMGSAHREAIARSSSGIGRWLLLDSAPLTAQVGRKTCVIGYGWNALTPIVSARGLLGMLVNDAGISGAPVDETRQAQAVIFCTLLANLLELARAERRLLSMAASEPCSVPLDAASGPAAAIAAKAVALLQNDHALSRAELAARLGLSVSGLSRAFKSEMGLSVAQYRGRLRLERFLTLVDPRAGNLLAAALDAGFGSYAQFHRVFRSALGKTPKEYLSER